jgi:hypothetical protein
MLYVIRLNQSRILLVRVLFLNGNQRERERKRGVLLQREGGMLFPVGLFPVPLVVVSEKPHTYMHGPLMDNFLDLVFIEN